MGCANAGGTGLSGGGCGDCGAGSGGGAGEGSGGGGLKFSSIARARYDNVPPVCNRGKSASAIGKAGPYGLRSRKNRLLAPTFTFTRSSLLTVVELFVTTAHVLVGTIPVDSSVKRLAQ